VRLGFPEKVLGEGGLPERDGRRWQNEPHLRVSLGFLEAIFGYLERHDLRFYRVSQGLAPYASHPGMKAFHGQVDECAGELARLGALARERGLRLTMHTNPYVVLSSAREEVLRSAVAELEWQSRLFDHMGMGPESVIVVHVGSAASERFVAGVERLPEHARARIVVENDDKTVPLVEVCALAERVGIPVVFDLMHHHINDPHGVPDDEALRMALATWPEGVTPKIHVSSPKTAMPDPEDVARRRWPRLVAHADLIDPLAFEAFLAGPAAGAGDFDVMLEARLKDLAVLHLREHLARRASTAPPARAARPA
jgi:UV DNA damage endonuclease